jgi:hypothetical protein
MIGVLSIHRNHGQRSATMWCSLIRQSRFWRENWMKGN